MSQLVDFSKGHVVICGDVMLDHYWYGHAGRISPEAPVPVVKVKESVYRPGGAANVAVNASALQASVSLMGVVGEDENATQLATLLKAAKVEQQLLSSAQPTITKLRVMGQNQQLLRMDFEQRFSDALQTALQDCYVSGLSTATAVVLSDYNKGTLHDPQYFIQQAVARRIPVLVDPKGSDFFRYRGATLLTPNLAEFEAVVGVTRTMEERITLGTQLMNELNLQALLITLSKEGMLLLQQGEAPAHLSAKAQEVFDVTGAGDTVIAVLASALASGYAMLPAVELANTAAGIVVGKVGAATVSVTELRRAQRQSEQDEQRVLSATMLQPLLHEAQLSGEKVVMTNGCFDLLHAGHVQYLEQARELGDRLVIAVNDDASVRRLKGDTRPVNALSERMAVLAALRCVDWVVPFSEDTPAELVASLCPDVLVKADDYTVDQIAGAASVLARGGEVKTLPLKPGCSTTSMIDKMTKQKDCV